MTVSGRFNAVGMAVFGPADTGPYGPDKAPPGPQPRDPRGRVISPKKIARAQATMVEVARVTEIFRLSELAWSDSDW